MTERYQVPFPRWGEFLTRRELLRRLAAGGMEPGDAEKLAEVLSLVFQRAARLEETNYEYLCSQVLSAGFAVDTYLASLAALSQSESPRWFLASLPSLYQYEDLVSTYLMSLETLTQQSDENRTYLASVEVLVST